MHRNVAAAIVAALALGVASCGGSETTTLSRAELVRQVRVACRDGRAQTTREMRDARGGGTKALANAVLNGQRSVMDKLDDMTTSGAAKADYEAFKRNMQLRIDQIERVAAADRADTERVIRAVQGKLEAASNRATAAARRLGIEGCI